MSDGVTVYVMNWVAVVVLTRTSLIIDEVVLVVKLSPVTLALSVAIQEKEVPVVFEFSERLTFDPLQMVSDALLVMTGEGLTVTLSEMGLPAHPLAVGVME